MQVSPVDVRRGAVPRGLATSGPALLLYGFRPFFLGAGMFAVVAMMLWIGALTLNWDIGGNLYGPLNYHAHEMIFGYAAAALAGFMLTAIPNWTGRLPVSGAPLAALVALWLAGRLVMVWPDILPAYAGAFLEAAFLPVLAGVAAREIIAGRNWKNLKILVALGLLSAVNVAFHAAVITDADPMVAFRAGVAVLIALIGLVGGRVVPSFTRNWLHRNGALKLPHPADRVDEAATAISILALLTWTFIPTGIVTAVLAGAAGLLQLWRLSRWCGLATVAQPIVFVMHVAYLFLPLGLAGIASAAMDWISPASALHILTVGAIGNMTLAIMTRATLGHTGRKLEASRTTSLAYAALTLAAVIRPLAELIADHYHLILGISGGAWILAFAIFSVEYGRMLVTRSPGRGS